MVVLLLGVERAAVAAGLKRGPAPRRRQVTTTTRTTITADPPGRGTCLCSTISLRRKLADQPDARHPQLDGQWVAEPHGHRDGLARNAAIEVLCGSLGGGSIQPVSTALIVAAGASGRWGDGASCSRSDGCYR